MQHFKTHSLPSTTLRTQIIMHTQFNPSTRQTRLLTCPPSTRTKRARAARAWKLMLNPTNRDADLRFNGEPPQNRGECPPNSDVCRVPDSAKEAVSQNIGRGAQSWFPLPLKGRGAQLDREPEGKPQFCGSPKRRHPQFVLLLFFRVSLKQRFSLEKHRFSNEKRQFSRKLGRDQFCFGCFLFRLPPDKHPPRRSTLGSRVRVQFQAGHAWVTYGNREAGGVARGGRARGQGHPSQVGKTTPTFFGGVKWTKTWSVPLFHFVCWWF